LGGALRTTAARLTQLAEGLEPSDVQRLLVQRIVPDLDEVGSRLQLHAQELAELVVSARRLADRVADAGLVLDGLRVLEPLGIVNVRDAERRIRARPSLQAHADRIAARLGRSRAELIRQLAAASSRLQTLTASEVH